MAFDQYSLFSYKHQTSTTGVMEINDILPEQDTNSYVPWSQNADDDDPYRLIQYAKSRNINGETEQEIGPNGLVSNILEGTNSLDNYFTEGKSIWSPNTLREDVLQYRHFEKTDPYPALSPNHTYPEPFNGVREQSLAKDVEELYQQLNGFETSEQWPFPSCNGVKDTCSSQSQKLLKPPGLPMSNATNTYLSKMRQSEHHYISANGDSGNCVPATSDSFAPQSKMSSLYVDPYGEDHSEGSSIKPIVNEQQEINRFFSNFQNVMAREQDGLHGRELHNTKRQAMEMLYEDSLAEQRKYTSPEMSVHTDPTMQIPKELVEVFEAWQRERSGARKQLFQGDGSNGFGPQNTKCFQKPKPNSALFNPTNSSQYNIATQNGNQSLPLNLNMNVNQHSEHHSQQSQFHIKFKQPMATCVPSNPSKVVSPSVPKFVSQNSHQVQRGPLFFQGCRPGRNQVGIGLDMRRGASDSGMQLDKNTMLKPAGLGEGFLAQCFDGNTRPHTSIHMSNDDRKWGLPQNMCHQGNMYNPQQVRGPNTNGARKKMPSLPFMCPLSDPRQSSGQMPFRPSNFNTYTSGAPLMDIGDMMPDTELTSFNPSASDQMGWHGKIDPGMTSVLRTPSVMMNQGRPVSELHFHLDKCYEQWRGLENERKKTEVILTEIFPGKRISVGTSSFLPKMSPNPSKVDRLVADQMREQATVARLLGQMECLRSIPFHAHITSAIDRHHEAILVTRARCKEEYFNTGGAVFGEDRGTQLLAMALKDLSVTTRTSRTALWCALQMTMPGSVEKLDYHVDSDDTCEESSTGKSLLQFLNGII